MAIEDAFVLATLLAEYWDETDGHVEAFYLYEVSNEKARGRGERLLFTGGGTRGFLWQAYTPGTG